MSTEHASPRSDRAVSVTFADISLLARKAAETAVFKAGHAGERRPVVPVRNSFIGTQKPGDPPLARILHGGGEVRLKLYLSMLLLGVTFPHDIDHAAWEWAELLDLDDVHGNGARRIQQAIAWLDRERFVKRIGKTKVRLRSDAGTGAAYTRPYANSKDHDTAPDAGKKPGDPEDNYVSVPTELWDHGWIMVLSGAALAVLLITLREDYVTKRGPRKTTPFVSPSMLQRQYGISDETWRKGRNELEAHHLVRIVPLPVRDAAFQPRRSRKGFRVHRDRVTDAYPGTTPPERQASRPRRPRKAPGAEGTGPPLKA